MPQLLLLLLTQWVLDRWPLEVSYPALCHRAPPLAKLDIEDIDDEEVSSTLR